MTLYKKWLGKAYDKDGKSNKKVWDQYIPLEQTIYEDILENKITCLKGTPKTFAEKYGMSVEFICGFLDGINDATENPINMEELEEDQQLTVGIEFEKLYKKMVEYKAKHLYSLPQWDGIFTPDAQKEMFVAQKRSKTVVKEATPSRNDPCPCASGKKYKKCCGMV